MEVSKSPNITPKGKSTAKRHLRADGLSLLPSALRPRLVGNNINNSSCGSRNNGENVNSRFIRHPRFRISALAAIILYSLAFSLLIQTSYISNTSAVSLTLTIPNKALSVDLNPTTNNGFAVSTAESIKVSTSASWGYELSVKAKDDNTLKNGTSSISSITTSIDESTFKTGTTYNNKWGFKPSKVNGSENDNFLASPTSSAPIVLEKTSASSSSPTSYTIAIGAKADNTLTTGTYSNNFTFTAVANTVSYNITYNLNEGEWTGTSPQTGSSAEQSIILDSHMPTRNNYTFQGWCSVSTTNNTCPSDGQIYQPGSEYALVNGDNIVDLYAMWKHNFVSMQNWNGCNSLETEKPIVMVDDRDNTEYTVAKLKDGKCWMTDNLRIGSNDKQTVLDPSTSDVASSFILPQGTTKTASSPSDTSGWHSEQYNTAHIYIDSNVNYGGYYTWYAATAGEGKDTISSGNTTHSICPKGWTLPTSNQTTALTGQYDTTTRNNNPPNFGSAVWAGNCDQTGCPRNQEYAGHWWPSTASSAHSVNDLVSVSWGFHLSSNAKGNGHSVRCIAR